MKISKETLAILKNFASINSNLLLKEGSVVSTMNAARNVLADATITEVFPFDFGIYDLNEFLGSLILFADPEVEFTTKFATISEGTSKIKFYAAAPDVLVIPTKKINFPKPDIEFSLSATHLNSVLKTASVLRATDLSFVGDGENISVTISDMKNSSSNSFTVNDVGTSDQKFTANFKIENLKLISQDYTVQLSKKKISKFSSKDEKIAVYIALEASSSFENE